MSQLLLSALIQISLFAVAFAEDTITVQDHGNAWKFGTGGGVIGLIVLILDLIVFFEIFNSSRPPINKLLWVLGVFFFPILGLIVYYLFSNRQEHAAGGGGYEQIA